jgi:hypothetical protein
MRFHVITLIWKLGVANRTEPADRQGRRLVVS